MTDNIPILLALILFTEHVYLFSYMHIRKDMENFDKMGKLWNVYLLITLKRKFNLRQHS